MKRDVKDPLWLRLARALGHGLQALGAMHVSVLATPPGTDPAHPAHPGPPPLQGPPPGHPEQLRPDIPLTALERALERRM